jgi:alkylation response protein AidB-like acyl-CoA dehydrogenase
MPTYKTPIRDLRFVLYELLGAEDLATLPGYESATPDVMMAAIEQTGQLCEEVLLPLNSRGDEEGCRYENGVVTTPAGFKDAYRKFAEGGWVGISCAPEYDGQGLPQVLNFVVSEIACASNLALSIYVGLSQGAYHGIEAHASEDLKKRYLPPLSTGRWTGTMCLTEPHCGTDLGLVRTRAERNEDGSYRVSGTKIFISAGEHDLAENIVHLVLARCPGGLPGTRGLGLFIVPKFLPNADGSVGMRNLVRCSSIERKMGIHGSATCVLDFEGATGFLVGRENQGIVGMFSVMNLARLAVGMQGLGLSEVAYQTACAYARERLQGRALGGPAYPDKPADPIIVHPEVRNMLMTMRALTEGGRALAHWVGHAFDVALRHPDATVRQEHDDLVQLMTPIVKSFLTDAGFEIANLCLQVHGGHGYIRDHGVEQLVRDARIGQVYEGTNGIQALDLVGRKMSQNTGRLLRRFFHPVDAFIAAESRSPEMEPFVAPLAKVFGRCQQATLWIAERGLADPNEGAAAARDYAALFGYMALGYMWARSAKIAKQRLAAGQGEDADFYRAKLATASYYFQRVLPRATAHAAALAAGAEPVMALAAEAF